MYSYSSNTNMKVKQNFTIDKKHHVYVFVSPFGRSKIRLKFKDDFHMFIQYTLVERILFIELILS